MDSEDLQRLVTQKMPYQAVEKRPIMTTEAVFKKFAHAICC